MPSSSPVVRIDTAATTPVYRQIVDSLRTALVSGALPSGTQLPTVRELGMNLGVHHNTVAEAYRVLADEGWLELRRYRGARVIERKPPRTSAHANARFRERLAALVAEARAAGVPDERIRGELAAQAKSI